MGEREKKAEAVPLTREGESAGVELPVRVTMADTEGLRLTKGEALCVFEISGVWEVEGEAEKEEEHVRLGELEEVWEIRPDTLELTVTDGLLVGLFELVYTWDFVGL